MSPERDVIRGVDLNDDRYTIKQHILRNKFNVYDSRGELVLKSKQKLFRMKEEFPFKDANGNPVFNIKAQSVLDIAGDYTLTDAASGDVIAVLSRNFTFVTHKWQVKDPQGNVQAVIRSKSKILNALRSISGLVDLIPHSYIIETSDGERMGIIKGKLSIRDTYELRIEHAGNMPKEGLVAAAIAVDALEGN